MSYSSKKKQLRDLEYFLQKKRVRTPKDIAQKLQVSEHTALRLIKQLKEEGINILYCVKEKRYKIF